MTAPTIHVAAAHAKHIICSPGSRNLQAGRHENNRRSVSISQEWRLVRDYLASRYLHAGGRVAAVHRAPVMADVTGQRVVVQ